MSFIGYNNIGIEQYVFVNEPNAATTVERVKEYVQKKVIDVSRIDTIYLMVEPNKTVQDDSSQISCFGDDYFVTISTCLTPDGYPDMKAIGQCMKMLGVKLTEEEEKGKFHVHTNGHVAKKYTL